jgi:hypothetical protein
MAAIIALIAAGRAKACVEPWLVLVTLIVSVAGMVGGPACILFTRFSRGRAGGPAERCWDDDLPDPRPMPIANNFVRGCATTQIRSCTLLVELFLA